MYAIISKTGQEPITLSELKTHLRVYNDDEDSYLTSLIVAARSYCEKYLRVPLLSTDIEEYFTSFSELKISFPNVSNVVLDYRDNIDGTYQTVNPSTYEADLVNREVILINDSTWPSDIGDYPNPVRLSYTSVPGEVDQEIIQAMFLIIGYWYENREDMGDTKLTKMPNYSIPRASERLLNMIREFEY